MSVQGPCIASLVALYCSIGEKPGVTIAVMFWLRMAIAARADPKSISTGVPSPRNITFSGLMSRCRNAAAWTCSNASRTGASHARNRSSPTNDSAL